MKDSQSELPPPLGSKLDSIRHRSRRLLALEGGLLAVIVLLAGMLLAMGLDWLIVLFNSAARFLLTGLVLAAAAVTLVRHGLIPLLRRRPLSNVALEVDRAFPALEERWSTVADLSESRDPSAVRGADNLIRKVRDEAVEMGSLVRAEPVHSSYRSRRYAQALAALAVLAAVFFAVAPSRTATLMARFWMPGREITSCRITAEPGDVTTARGEPLTLIARVANDSPAGATLLLRRPAGQERVRLNTVRPGEFSWQVRDPQEPFEYRFRAGDAQTPWHRVGVEERPALTNVSFSIQPPSYTGLPAENRDLLPGRCRALRGSELSVGFNVSKPLAGAELRFENGETLALVPTLGGRYRFHKLLEEPLAFTLTLTDGLGLTAAPPPSCRVLLYEDRPPTVRILTPRDDEVTLRADDTLTVEFTAGDDFGIASAELLVSTGAPATSEEAFDKVIPIPLEQLPAKSVRGKAAFSLAPLKLQDGDVISYAVRVTDTRLTTSQAAGTLGEPGEMSEGDCRGTPTDRARNRRRNTTTAAAQAQVQATATRAASASLPKAAPAAGSQPGDNQAQSAAQTAGITPRLIDIQAQSCSRRQCARIDSKAGTPEAKAKEKLQIAISSYLQRLDESLAAAEGLTAKAIPLAASQPAAELNEPKGADEHLAVAEATIRELRALSDRTPYAFIGLQLHEIGVAHIAPARTALAAAAALPPDFAAQSEHLRNAAFHIARARAMLADLTRRYEAVVRQEKVQEAMQQLAKMHTILLEDMYRLLGSGKPGLNPRTGKMLEVSDEYVAKLRDRYEQLKKLLSELAKVLEQDPDLLRRFMARTRLEGVTLRDQLTVLARRQAAVRDSLVKLAKSPSEDLPALQAEFIQMQAAQQAELTTLAATLQENIETWQPRDLRSADGALADTRKLATEIAMTASRPASELAAGEVDAALSSAAAADDRLRRLEETLGETLAEHPEHEKLAMFVTSRREEIARLRARQSGMVQKLRSLREGLFGTALSIDQDLLAHDTVEFGGKIDRLSAFMTPGPAAEKCREIALLMNETIIPDQRSAVTLLLGKPADAWPPQNGLVAAFARAEKLFDELLTIIETQAKAPTTTQMSELPTLEKLLAALENECRACEKLGAVIRLNIWMQQDWMSQGDNGSGSGQNPGPPGPTEALADALAKAAREHARSARRDWQPRSGAGDDRHEEIADLNERDWDTFVSQLRDELRQAGGHLPPDQYQKAIDRYFQLLARMAPQSAPGE